MALMIERSMRLPWFAADVPIVLGNGEAFHFRPPRFVRWPEFGADGTMDHRTGFSYGPDWVDRWELCSAAVDSGDGGRDITEDVMWFADQMLMRNYKEELRRHYKSILSFTIREPDCVLRYRLIWDLVLGNDPKGLTSDGSVQL